MWLFASHNLSRFCARVGFSAGANSERLVNPEGVFAATLQAVHIHLLPLVVTGIVVDGHLFVHCTVVIAQLVQI